MLSKSATYLLFVSFALILSIGATIAAFTDCIPTTGPVILLSAIPLAVMMLGGALLNYRVLIPRLLIGRQKTSLTVAPQYIYYMCACFAIAIAIPLLGIAMEAAIRNYWDLPHRIHNYFSPWILVDSLSNASLLMVIMLGMGVANVYRLWHKEVKREDRASEVYRHAAESLTATVRPDEVMEAMERITNLAAEDADAANAELRKLSERLRHELYDQPRPQVKNVALQTKKQPSFSWLSDFISAKRFTFLRDICLKLLIACVALTAIFDAPDAPALSSDGLWAFLGMFVVLCILTYGNKSLSKHFLNKGKLGTYMVAGLIFLLAMTVVIIVIEIISYVHTIHNGSLPPLYSGLATLSSFCTILLYFGGVTSLIVLHNWLRTVRRVAALKAETAKAEFSFLQSQINPHFLFNVLNNAGILIYEDPPMAMGMLRQLREMFEYQFSITNKSSVKLVDEVAFIRNYLLLEQSRKAPFNFDLKVECSDPDLEIPTLLLIPFVENASKHSTGNRNIKIFISASADYLNFVCENLAASSTPSESPGASGVGIVNTRRRLHLLYSDASFLTSSLRDNIFKVTLQIPLNK